MPLLYFYKHVQWPLLYGFLQFQANQLSIHKKLLLRVYLQILFLGYVQLYHYHHNVIFRSHGRNCNFYAFHKKKEIHCDGIYHNILTCHHIFSTYHKQIRLLYHIEYILIQYRSFLRYRSESFGRKIFFPYRRRS